MAGVSMNEQFEVPPKVKQFDLGPYREHWVKMLDLEEAAKEHKAYKERFKELAADADEFVLDGEVVASNRIAGAFQPSQLKADLPHMYNAYLKDKVVKEFDEPTFKEHNPEMWNRFRSRSLRKTTTKPTK
jgi:hypothetical protein